MTDEPAVVIKEMSFAYGAAPVLEEVNLTVTPGDFACIVGPNGGGKTTLLKVVLGQLAPYHGTVQVLGGPPQRALSRIGYVPQYQSFDIHFPVRVLDVVLMGRLRWNRLLGLYSAQDREAGRAALAEVGLEGLERRPFSALSGGQRQRTLIARALVSWPELLLLDEPTAHVDIAAAGEIHRLLMHLNTHMTIMMVSHDLSFVQHPIKSVICVNRRVDIHPAADITGEIISEVYGREVHIVKHNHAWAKGGDSCSTS